MILPFSDNSDTFQICNAWLSDSISLIRALFFSFNLLLYTPYSQMADTREKTGA